MLTLAIDTATKVCAVGLCRDGQILAEYRINMGMTHSEGLMPQLEQLLTRTKITKNEIDLLAVSMGPGSFTGLRIGLASAEAMAYSWHKSADRRLCIITCFRRTKRKFLSGDL